MYYEKIADIFPRQRGKIAIDNLTMLNFLEHGCIWRGLPSSFGTWHSIYARMSRWSKNGGLDRFFKRRRMDDKAASYCRRLSRIPELVWRGLLKRLAMP